MKKVLITGGTGLIGQHLSEYLGKSNYDVSVLSRKKHGNKSFLWDIDAQTMDEEALDGVDSIVHLAGSGIADKRWTDSYKKEIIESRVSSARLILETIKKSPNHSVKTFISASGVGYYGDSEDAWVDEMFRAKDDFMGTVCSKWEEAAHKFEALGIRVVILRTGIVLAKEGGALPELTKPIRLFAGAPLGDGKQYLSWIHIEDMIRLYEFAITNEKLNGVFNASSPKPATNKEFTKTIASVIHRPVWPFNVPAFVLQMLLGEKAAIVLEGQRATSEKIRMAGFEFKHVDLKKALEELL